MGLTKGSIIVFAKCPIAGSSKTRLSSLLGDEGAARLAKAMLCDILACISEHVSSHYFVLHQFVIIIPLKLIRQLFFLPQKHLSQRNKVLVYAPGTRDGEIIMKAILVEIGLTYASLDNQNATSSQKTTSTQLDNKQDIVIASPWILLPMVSLSSSEKPQSDLEDELDNLGNPISSLPANSHDIVIDAPDDERDHIIMKNQESNVQSIAKADLQSSDLGSKLADALERVRQIQPNNPVVFLGMDSPELPLDEIALAMSAASSKPVGKAYLNPAHDGGYGMLCIPKQASSNIFEGIRWSSSLTAVSQMKALSDNGVDTIVGSLMNDIDEPDDVKYLAIRLSILHTQAKKMQSQNPSFQVDRLLYKSNIVSKIKVGKGESLTNPMMINDAGCFHTFQCLQDLDLINRRERKQRVLYTINASKWD